MLNSPPVLDRAGIAARLPHAGRMCLLERVIAWDQRSLRCAATSHRDEHHPLRETGGLPVWAGLEYAAQAAAVHGALLRQEAAPRRGVLAALREARAARAWLHDVSGELRVQATLLHGDPAGAVYAFELHAQDGALLLAARLTLMYTAPAGAEK